MTRALKQKIERIKQAPLKKLVESLKAELVRVNGHANLSSQKCEKLAEELETQKQLVDSQNTKLQASHENVDCLLTELRAKRQEVVTQTEEMARISTLLEEEKTKTICLELNKNLKCNITQF